MSTLVYLAIAAVAGIVVGWYRRAAMPYVIVACALAGLIAGVFVSLPLGDKGPHLAEVAVAPAAAGALVGALAMRLALAVALRRVPTG